MLTLPKKSSAKVLDTLAAAAVVPLYLPAISRALGALDAPKAIGVVADLFKRGDSGRQRGAS
ncbi:hypothetical protein OOZ63_17665 [Paucibacter sp. PLA-PC-4]|uniref:hypothetical protein n=1 Tax=Paucibacter sp. PLA-PC-4 TaxID=2993655 RepID=UPI00224A589B|nr:hypothetical protein [Paucibacter sp. PLA-PC-4]MCX2863661.1 hypothetical protein [Paucibacter sp. PLA-PC-4]